jgi:hypothetical protein
MNISNGRLYDAYTVLTKQVMPCKGISIRNAHEIARLVVALDPAVQSIEMVRGTIAKDYIEKDKDGTPVPVLDEDGKVQPDKVKLTQEGITKMTELLSKEVQVTVEPIPLSVFDGVELPEPVQVMIALRDFIVKEPNASSNNGAVAGTAGQ